jgi:hypothetical protein
LKKSYMTKKTLSPGNPDIVFVCGFCLTCDKTGGISCIAATGAPDVTGTRGAAAPVPMLEIYSAPTGKSRRAS